MYVYRDDPPPQETVTEIAVKESTRQLIILGFGLAGTILTIVVIRYASNPDAWRTLKMKSALTVKRWTQKQADFWQRQADKAATLYHKERE